MRIIRPAIFLVVFSGFMHACAPALRMNRDYQLHYGEQMKYRTEGFRKEVILFEGVVEDSRCPTGVQCIQAGRALVQLAAGDSTWVMQEGETSKYKNRQILLKSLLPYPNARDTVPPGPENYRIVLRFAAGH